MKTITHAVSREAYATPSTRIIEVILSGLMMDSFTTRGSQSEELDELGTTSHGDITWN